MKEEIACRFLAAAPECAQAKIEGILSAIGMTPDEFCTSGEATLAAAQDEHVMLLTTVRLPDMSGMELARRLGENADVLLVVPGDFAQEDAQDCGALLLRNPITQDALAQALRATRHMQGKMNALRARAKKLERTLEERKIIDRAKGRMMDELHMTEKQAHYAIQKKSMDLGRRIADIAREILEAETLAED